MFYFLLKNNTHIYMQRKADPLETRAILKSKLLVGCAFYWYNFYFCGLDEKGVVYVWLGQFCHQMFQVSRSVLVCFWKSPLWSLLCSTCMYSAAQGLLRLAADQMTIWRALLHFQQPRAPFQLQWGAPGHIRPAEGDQMDSCHLGFLKKWCHSF